MTFKKYLTNRFLFRSIKIFLYIGIFFAIQQLCHRVTDGFRVYKITSKLPYNEKWDSPLLISEDKLKIHQILNQKFHYLGCGLQCYVFRSDDDNYVIKVFKHHHMRPVGWINYVRLPGKLDKMRTDLIKTRERRLKRNFLSYKIAYENFKDETGVIYIHLNKTHEFDKGLILIDPIGIEHPIDLNNTEFILQKKAALVYPTLEKKIQSGDLKGAKDCLDSLLKLILDRGKKGIADLDPVVWRNFWVHRQSCR